MRNRLFAMFMAMAVCVGLVSSTSVMAQQSDNCVSDFGDKVPVLMVHGQNNGPAVWGDDNTPSMFAVLDEKSIVRDRFNYSSVAREWVTNSAIGPALAKRIDCLSQSSLKGGGKGKVIVLAHSMGSLAARFALNQTVAGRKVADAGGLVITIGAPHGGSSLANLCEELAKVKVNPAQCQGSAVPAMKVGSKELDQLPPFPPNVAVKALMGDVTINTVIFPSPTAAYIPVPTFSDLVVPITSAQQYATKIGKGDGARKFSCNGWVPIPSFSDAPCEHNNLLKMPEVQQEVKASIEQYVASIQKPNVPSGHKVTLFNKLTLTYLDTWKKGFSTPNVTEDIADGTNCAASAAECPHIMVVNLDAPEARASYGGSPVNQAAHDCMLEQDENGHKPAQQPKLKGTETVDGESVKFYEQDVCPPYLSGEKAYFWYAEKRGILIDASGSGLTGGSLALDKLKAVIANIDWK
jgi:triacylglycerol esterase/lipase EstA (alpha/beta hydrolase family)